MYINHLILTATLRSYFFILRRILVAKKVIKDHTGDHWQSWNSHQSGLSSSKTHGPSQRTPSRTLQFT